MTESISPTRNEKIIVLILENFLYRAKRCSNRFAVFRIYAVTHVAICILLAAFMSQAFGQPNIPLLVKQAKSGVVTIYKYDEDNYLIGQGSGFIINENGEIITCYHVLSEAYWAKVKYVDGQYGNLVYILAENREDDIILAGVFEDKDVKPLNVTENLPEVGEMVVVFGSPFGLEQTVTVGNVSAIRGEPGNEIIQLSAPSAPGSSGGPVLNLSGEVIGVVTGRRGEVWQNLHFAVPAERISALRTVDTIAIVDWSQSGERKEGFSTFFLGLLENHKRAIQYLKQAIEDYLTMADVYNQDRSIWGDVYFKIGRSYSLLGLQEQALRAYDKATTINDEHLEAYKNLGQIYIDMEKYFKAIPILERALRIKPDDEDIHNMLGDVYFEIEDYEEAIDCYKQAVFYCPNWALAHFNLGKTYLKMSDKVSALTEYKMLQYRDKMLAKELFDMIYENKIPPGEKQYKDFFNKDDTW